MKKTLIEEIKAAEKTAHNSVERARQNKDSVLVRAQKQGRQDLETVEKRLASFKEKIAKETDELIAEMKTQERKNLRAELKKLEIIDLKKINQAAGIVFKKLID